MLGPWLVSLHRIVITHASARYPLWVVSVRNSACLTPRYTLRDTSHTALSWNTLFSTQATSWPTPACLTPRYTLHITSRIALLLEELLLKHTLFDTGHKMRHISSSAPSFSFLVQLRRKRHH